MMFTKRTILVFSWAAALFTFWTIIGMGSGLTGVSHAGKKYTFTMQNMFSLNHPITIAINEMVAEIKKESDGKIDIQVLPAGALVKGPNIFETVGNGSIDMGTTCSTYHAGILPVGASHAGLFHSVAHSNGG